MKAIALPEVGGIISSSLLVERQVILFTSSDLFPLQSWCYFWCGAIAHQGRGCPMNDSYDDDDGDDDRNGQW